MRNIIQNFAERRLALTGMGINLKSEGADETETGNGEEAAPEAPAADAPANGGDAGQGDGDAPSASDDAETATDDATNGGDDAGAGSEDAAAAAPAADVVRLCNDAGFPEMAESLIREAVSLGVVEARLNLAQQIKAEVTTARRLRPELDPALAGQFIAAGASLEHVRSQLFERMMAMEAAPTVSVHGSHVDTGAGAGAETIELNPATIYANRAKAREGWPIYEK